jgi:hypothetical protein
LIRKRDEDGAIQAIGQLEPDQKLELFPIQIISPEQFTRTYGADYTNGKAEVLYLITDESIETGTQLASTSRKSPCRMIASTGPAHRILQSSQAARKVQFSYKRIQSGDLSAQSMTLGNVTSSEKLNFFKQIAALMEPLYGSMTIYNTKHVQLASFLGPKLDTWLLDELSFPYKLHEEGMHPTSGFLVECLLDQKKPILLLLRDGLFSPEDHRAVLWQNYVMRECNRIGFPIHNSWTTDWMNRGKLEMEKVKAFILEHLPEYASQEQMKSA